MSMDNLAKDAAEALKANMTYGKWKAMQNPVKVEKKKPEGLIKCVKCGKEFKPVKNQRYCDYTCQQMACAERRREKHNEYNRKYRAKMKEMSVDG